MSGQRVISELNFIVYSFIEVVPFLLSLEGAKFVLTKNFNQDNVQCIIAHCPDEHRTMYLLNVASEHAQCVYRIASM